MKILLFMSCIFLMINCVDKSQDSINSYFGQTPPEDKAEIFAPGLITTGANELNISFSPDGNEMFYFVTGPRYNPRIILHSYIQDGKWITPVELPFHDEERTDSYPFITPDGKKLFFNSSRHYEGKPDNMGHHHEIWYAEKDGRNWGEPKRVEFEGGFNGFGTFPSVANSGNIYFNARMDTKTSDLYISEYIDGKYKTPKKLSDKVNSSAQEFHPYIAPDESYILFDSTREEDSFGSQDIFISFRDKNGTWTKAKNLGERVNSPNWDIRPFVSFDGKYLFFISSRVILPKLPGNSMTMNKALGVINKPGNGSQDIYWIDAKIIKELRP